MVAVVAVVVVLQIAADMIEAACNWVAASAVVVIAGIVGIADLYLVAVALFNPPINITQYTFNLMCIYLLQRNP